MKIYQVFEYGGCWEDSYKTCIGTFLSNKNAEDYMDELQLKKEEELKFSNGCIICDCVFEDKLEESSKDIKGIEKICKQMEKRCNSFNPEIIEYQNPKGEFYLECNSRVRYNEDFSGFCIAEYEVLDWRQDE